MLHYLKTERGRRPPADFAGRNVRGKVDVGADGRTAGIVEPAFHYVNPVSGRRPPELLE